MGFRGKDISPYKESNEIRILICGASTSVDQAEFYKSWPGLLEKKLSEFYPDKNIVVLVQATGAYFTSDNLVFYVLRSQDYNFDLIIVYDGWNDITPSATKGFMSDYSHSRGRPFADKPLTQKIGTLINHIPFLKYSGIIGIVRHRISKKELTEFNNSLYKAAGHPSYGFRGMDTFKRNLETIAKLGSANGSKVLFISHVDLINGILKDRDAYLYHIVQKEHNDIVKQIGTSFPNCSFFDLDSVFPQDKKYFNDRIHFTEDGSKTVASKIFEYCKNKALVKQWNKNNYKRTVIYPFSDIDEAIHVGPSQYGWPLIGVISGDITRAAVRVHPHSNPHVENGFQIPLGFLPKGKYRLNIGMGYDASQYKKELTQGGGAGFTVRIIANGTKTTILQKKLFPGKNYTIGEFQETGVEFSVGSGNASIEFLTSLEGKEENNSLLWLYPVIYIEHS